MLAIKLLNLETQCKSKQNALGTVNTQLCPSSLGCSLPAHFWKAMLVACWRLQSLPFT